MLSKRIFTGFVALALIAGFMTASAPAQKASAAGYMFNTNLTVGSTGPDVSALQTILVANGKLTMPSGVAMGYFGGLTQSALASWQASAGITPAAGFFGPITRAYFNTHDMGGSMPGNGGCPVGALFDPITGHPCTGGTSTCPPGALFDPQTGHPCSGGSTVSGGAGDISTTEKNSGTEDQVIENDTKVKVLGLDIEADGSDVAITSIRVELEHTGSGSDRMERYVDAVHIMMGSTVVGSADASDFSKDSNEYSRNIPLNSAIVKDGEKTRFYVAVDAVNNIDSNDLGTDWDVAVGNIRFEDGTGAILTDSHAGLGGDVTNTFTFEDLASAGDVQLTVNEDDTSINDAHTVQVDDTSDTNDVDVLSFTIEAEGTDATLKSIGYPNSFLVTSSGAGVTEIANDFRLMMGSDEVGTATLDKDCDGGSDGFASSSDASICINIDNLEDDDVMIDEDSTENFTLVADINDIGGGFTNGDSLSVAIDADDIDAEDANGDAIADLSGSANSTSIAFASTGVNLAMGSDDTSEETFNPNATSSSFATYEVNFDVTAFEDTVWVALNATNSTSTTPAAGAHFFVEDASADDVKVLTGTISGSLTRVSGGTLDGNYVRINAGQTAHMRLTVTYDPSTPSFYRANLFAVNYALTKVAGTTQQLALPTSDYQTPDVYVH